MAFMRSPSLDESRELTFFRLMGGSLHRLLGLGLLWSGVVDGRDVVRSGASSVFSGGFEELRFDM